jgi:hypothetical protein
MSAMNDYGFLKKSVARRRMAGKGAPVETLPGVMGRQVQSAYAKSLGGLINDTKHLGGPLPEVFSDCAVPATERGAVSCNPPSTKVSGLHYGQVLYSGPMMGNLGERLGVRE